MLQRSVVIKNQVSAVSVRLASTKGSRWKFWAKEGKEEEESLELPSEADMFSMQQEEYRREAEMEAVQQKRNKSRLAASHRQMLRGEAPNTGLRFEYSRHHHSQEFKRKMLGSYGAKATGVDPGICWPTDEQVDLAGKWEEMYQDKPLIEQIRDAKAGIVKRKEDRIAREKAVDEGLAKMEAQIKQWKARVNSKNMAAEHERLRREKVLAELREEFGYNVNPNDKYMMERIAEREKAIIKQERDAKRAMKKEKFETMFSAFKKLTTKNENGNVVSPNNVQSMSTNLQKKFAKGCNYNMKIVIRGDKNTGKTCLLARLQGQPFIEEYSTTEEIQVASINWSYKNTEDIVKVEVWDVVDVAKKRKKLAGLKMAGDADEFETGLDASFIDVYKGCHGAILVFDITKPWTWEYVKREVAEVPGNIPVLILANFTDASHHRQVSRLQVADFVETVVREGKETAEIRWGETSLRNGFGLKFLHKFFNVPFLTLQRQSLLQQLELNSRDILATQQELDLFQHSEEADYSQFSSKLSSRRREAAELSAPAPSASIVVGQPSNTVDPSQAQFAAAASEISYSSSSSKPTPASDPAPGGRAPAATVKTSPTKYDVDTFVPDEGDFDNFLDETDSARSKPSTVDNNIDSSDEDDGVNPMVAKFDDDDEDVEIDNYESSVTKVKDLSDDSDSEEVQRTKTAKVAADQDCDELDDFLNEDNIDHSVDSMHKDYESI